jgi:hypothetical protein
MATSCSAAAVSARRGRRRSAYRVWPAMPEGEFI